jgi:uncharacterized protein DUF3892
MATTRIVTKTGKDKDGDITSLCKDGEAWSPRSKAGAIADIKGGSIEYRVKSSTGPLIEVVAGKTGDYLRSSADASSSDNLDNLPDC